MPGSLIVEERGTKYDQIDFFFFFLTEHCLNNWFIDFKWIMPCKSCQVIANVPIDTN